ncbi:MAG TPA: site-specific integrase [Bryobacteraceae bacterium]|nr:site-specific integrase [Bryobacteraceae bacterium]
MSVFKRGKTWWYEFWFAGRRLQESAKTSSKTIAKQAEQKRRRELEEGFNRIEDHREEGIRTIRDVGKEYLEGYALRNRSATFAEYAVGHVSRLLGTKMLVDVDEATVHAYQEQRLREKAAPKTINEEVGFLLRLLGERGELLRAHLRKQKTLKLKGTKPVAKAYSPEEKQLLLEEAGRGRSPATYPALMLALNAGMRNGEIRNLQWKQIDLKRQFLTVGRSKTEAGEGRTIPLNPALLEALQKHAEWYQLRFGGIEPEWYLFPFGQANHLDPTRPITTLKTGWINARDRAGVKGRLHDSRHTLITELAESGASDQTIMDIAGHVSRQMLKHYSHIRMKAKREALDAVWKKHQENPDGKGPDRTQAAHDCSPERSDAQKVEGESLQKSLQSGVSEGMKHSKKARKPLKRIGSPRRTLLRNGFGETGLGPPPETTNRFDSRRSGLAVDSVVKDQTAPSSILESESCDGLCKRRIRGVGSEFLVL